MRHPVCRSFYLTFLNVVWVLISRVHDPFILSQYGLLITSRDITVH